MHSIIIYFMTAHMDSYAHQLQFPQSSIVLLALPHSSLTKIFFLVFLTYPTYGAYTLTIFNSLSSNIALTTITLSIFLNTSTTFPFFSLSNITPTPFFVLVLTEYMILYCSTVFLVFSPCFFHTTNIHIPSYFC